MKILITGDRNWDDVETVVSALSTFPSGTILVHGACRGADVTGAAVGEQLGFELRAYPADWDRYGKGAGPVRNQQMIDTEHKPYEPILTCFAFHKDIKNSKGTADMVSRAKKAGIKVVVFEGGLNEIDIQRFS